MVIEKMSINKETNILTVSVNVYREKFLKRLLISLKNQSLKETINEFSGKNFSNFKNNLSELVIEKISPISSEIRKILKDEKYIDEILQNGAQKAEELATKKVNDMKKIIGF